MPDGKSGSALSSQLDKFKEPARQLGADDDPERFKERVGKLVKPTVVVKDNVAGRRKDG